MPPERIVPPLDELNTPIREDEQSLYGRGRSWLPGSSAKKPRWREVGPRRRSGGPDTARRADEAQRAP